MRCLYLKGGGENSKVQNAETWVRREEWWGRLWPCGRETTGNLKSSLLFLQNWRSPFQIVHLFINNLAKKNSKEVINNLKKKLVTSLLVLS